VTAALVAAEALAFFGKGSAFVTYLMVGCVVGVALLVLARGRIQRQSLKDLLGITAALLVLVFVGMLMIIGEYLLG
jgi:hypothetical protein